MNSDLAMARAVFAELPDEAFEMWLRPLIEDHGWSFSSPSSDLSGTRWRDLLLEKPLCEWSKFRWERKTLPFSETLLHPISHDHANGIMLWHSYKFSIYRNYGNLKNGEVRLRNCVDSILRNKRLPAPIVLVPDDRGLMIADGHHRIAALYTVCFHREISPSGFPVDAWVAS